MVQTAFLAHSLQRPDEFPSETPVFEHVSIVVEKSQLPKCCITGAVGDIDTELVELLSSIDLKANLLGLTASDDRERDVFASRQHSTFISGEKNVTLPLPVSRKYESQNVRACG